MSRETKQDLIEELIHQSRVKEAATEAFDEVACQALGINRTDARCLDIVQNQGSMTAGRLAELSGLTTAAVTAVLDRLERAGYARRVRDVNDRRSVIVELTPLLSERAHRIWGPLAEDAGADLRRLSVDELKLITEFFRRGGEVNQRHVERVRNLSFEPDAT